MLIPNLDELQMSRFRLEACAVPTFWCGDGPRPVSTDPLVKYTRSGTRHECLQKGFGAGMHTEKKKTLPTNSLQQIKYIGPKYEKNFKKAGIRDLPGLRAEMSGRTTSDIERMLKKITAKAGGSVDVRAYNAVLVYLYQHGIGTLPACKAGP